MAQKHNAEYAEQPMTRYGKMQGPSRRYRRLRHPNFPAALWTAKNPLLQRGEIGIELDTHKAKVGDGTTYWNDLPYSFTSEIEWGSIVGDIADQTDLDNALSGKVDKTSVANQVYGTDGDGNQTTYNASDFDAVVDVKVNDVSVVTNKVANINLATVATSGDYDDLLNKPTLGTMAAESASDYTPTASLATVATSGQYSDLTGTPGVMTGASAGDAGTSGLVPAPAAGDQGKFLQGDGTWATPTAATAWGNITGTLSDQTDLQSALNAKQDTLTAGTNITITSNTISATDTTYTGSDGITLTGTNFTNSGVRSVASGTTNGTINVNTGGTTADVAVTGLGSAAYTASSAYATSAQGGKADTAVQPGDLATVATSGDYGDLLNKPTIPTVNDATLTIQKNGTTVNTFTANASSNVTANITVPTKISDLTNDSNFANTDLSNLTSTGANIGNWSSNVSNCVTESIQDIKLELNAGTLTLKAGSKVYVPNGAGVFDEITIASDLTNVSSGSATNTQFLIYNGSGIFPYLSSGVYSGATQPTPSTQYAVWYDTANNKVKTTADTGSTWQSTGSSFPIAIISKTNGVWTSIDQVFDGFGCIGSTAFALSDLEYLCSNGRNSDGTLKNTKNKLTTCVVGTETNTSFNGKRVINITSGGTIVFDSLERWFVQEEEPPRTNYNIWENPATNEIHQYLDGVWNKRTSCVLGITTETAGKITSFSRKQVFRAVDYSDSEYIAHQAMPSARYVDLTFPTSGTTLTAPADGYFVFVKTSGIAGAYINAYKSTATGSFRNYALATSQRTNEALGFTVLVQKGDNVTISYNATGTNYEKAVFVYANGAK